MVFLFTKNFKINFFLNNRGKGYNGQKGVLMSLFENLGVLMTISSNLEGVDVFFPKIFKRKQTINYMIKVQLRHFKLEY